MNQPDTNTNSSFNADNVWKKACAELEVQLTPAVYNTWIISNPLTDLRIVSEEKAVGTITSPTAFHATNIKKNLQLQITQAISKVINRHIDLDYKIGTPTPPAKNRKTYNQPQLQNAGFSPAFSDNLAPAQSLPQFGNTPIDSNQNESRDTNNHQDNGQYSGSNQQHSASQNIQSPASPSQSPRVEDLFSPQMIQQNTVNQAEFQARKAGLRLDYTFKTFAVSTTNEMAHAAATAVSQNPGTAYNPLFLYGGVGVGKTHLMHAIGNNIIFNNPSAKIIYCTGEEFTNEIVSAIQTKKALQFKNKYRNVNVLLIDDVQFLAGKNAVQEEFFHTFNAITQGNGQIVMTSDRPPHEINLLEDRLRSRFEAGLMIDIGQPTFELRTAILLIKTQAHHLNIPMDIAQSIAAKVDSARKIEGIITSLRSEVELKGKEITQQLVDQLLTQTENGFQTAERLRVSPSDVIRAVANHFHIKQIVVKGKKRQKAIVKARHLAMFLLKQELDLPYTEIGRWFSNRDHTSAMHAYQKIEKNLKVDPQLQQDLSAITMNLRAISK